MVYEASRNEEIVKEEVEDSYLIDLPPGFRFHPTDEELINHYLKPKVLNSYFSCLAICEVDLNKVEPWDLPWKAKIGEKEWYFFCIRDRKYPTGLRTNRATKAGYWKATGKDKEIFNGRSLVGMKKTLVFYKGRAPKGVKTNWIMHEYRLYDIDNLPKTVKNEWVISRVFQKRADGKKMHISDSCVNQFKPFGLPPLSHVTCFSDQTTENKCPLSETESKEDFNITMSASSSTHLTPNIGFLPWDPLSLEDNFSVLKMLLDSQETLFKQNSATLEGELTTTTWHNHDPSRMAGSVEEDLYWNILNN